jgi:hypothetical protein
VSADAKSADPAPDPALRAAEQRVHAQAAPTAKLGWPARLAGFVKQLFNPVREQVAPLPDPPQIPANLMDEEVQLEGDGFGPLLGRRYALAMRSDANPSAVMDRVKRNLVALSPDEFAAFEKTNGVPWVLKLGDEFDIQILGPWNGRVRVIETTPDAFSFVTLRGHPEAGRIRFSLAQPVPGRLVATITSWARSRDAVVDLGYGKLGVGKNLQATTWSTFLERIAALEQAPPIGQVVVSERKLDDADSTPRR